MVPVIKFILSRCHAARPPLMLAEGYTAAECRVLRHIYESVPMAKFKV